MNDAYRPIACADHERLEFAVLRHEWISIAVDGDDGAQRLLPRDVYTRDGAEWLVANTANGETLTLRLDQITLAER